MSFFVCVPCFISIYHFIPCAWKYYSLKSCVPKFRFRDNVGKIIVTPFFIFIFFFSIFFIFFLAEYWIAFFIIFSYVEMHQLVYTFISNGKNVYRMVPFLMYLLLSFWITALFLLNGKNKGHHFFSLKSGRIKSMI